MPAPARDPDLLARLSLASTAIARAFPASDFESKHLVTELRQNDERTRFALGAARAGVWEAELETGRVIWSETMHLVMGRAAEAFGGTVKDMIAAIHPADRKLIAPALRLRGDEPRDFEIEVRVDWQDGTTHGVQLRGRVVPGNFGRPAHVLGVAQDVTGRQALELQLRQSQKMEAMGRLAGGVAHDFNNILTAILGYALLIEEDPADATRTRAHAAQIRQAAERAASLTRQLLDFSRRQVVQRKPIQISRVVNELMPMVEKIMGEHIRIVRDLGTGFHAAFADAGQMEQIVLNLAINARDAMPLGGELSFATSDVTIAATDAVCCPPLVPGEYGALIVSDTGTGMDSATCERVFEPFFTTKEIGQGTGLGLSTVHEIVKSMGGGICVTSEAGFGTSFRVYFPKCDALSTDLEMPSGLRPQIATGHETILLVEDEEPVRMLVSDILERNGYSVLMASNASEAQAIVAASGRTIDMVVTDVMMPDGTGPELVAALEAIGPPLCALYMSGHAGAALAKQGRLDPRSRFLQKPFSAPELLAKIRHTLDSTAA